MQNNFTTSKILLRRGFTLIELLVVIAIIGILASIIVAAMNSSRKKARDVQRIGHIKEIRTALEFYYDKYDSYPIGDENATGNPTDFEDLVTEGYIPQLPLDPTAGTRYQYKSLTADNAGNLLDCTGEPCNHYHLGANLELDGTTAAGTGGHDVLRGDYDINTGFADDFPGLSSDCVTAGADDGCYDMVPL